MQVSDFAVSLAVVREEQLSLYGFNRRHSVPRWSLIINGEVGKLNHALEDLVRHLEKGEGTEIAEVAELAIKVRDQVVQSSACMLAMLQECPAFAGFDSSI